MSIAFLLVFLLGAAVAFMNGANDVSKGIATLVGSGVTSYRRAVLWGGAWTAVGGMAAVAWGGAMAATFGGGLLASGTTATYPAAIATIAGAMLWVLIATRRGLPVSTTHAIVGSLTGVAVFAYGVDGVRWGTLGARVLLPLLLSPIVAFALVNLIHLGVRAAGWRGDGSRECLCANMEPATLMALHSHGMERSVGGLPIGVWPRVFRANAEACAHAGPATLRLGVDQLHWLTSGLTSLARGMNDAPKLAALTITAAALAGAGVSTSAMLVLVTLGMAAGSMFAGLRVTRVLAEDVTPLDHREGFLANLVTSSLVLGGAFGGLPMSTTHVAASAIMGTGTQRAQPSVNRTVVARMLLAWVVTLPAGAALGVLSYVFLKRP